MDILQNFEKNRGSLDECAGTNGEMLKEIVNCWLKSINRMDVITEDMVHLNYHIGKIVYILDAFEDYDKDIKKNRFNSISFLTEEMEKMTALWKVKKVILLLEYCISKEFDKINLNTINEQISNFAQKCIYYADSISMMSIICLCSKNT